MPAPTRSIVFYWTLMQENSRPFTPDSKKTLVNTFYCHSHVKRYRTSHPRRQAETARDHSNRSLAVTLLTSSTGPATRKCYTLAVEQIFRHKYLVRYQGQCESLQQFAFVHWNPTLRSLMNVAEGTITDASRIDRAARFRLFAMASNSRSSSSELAFSAIFACLGVTSGCHTSSRRLLGRSPGPFPVL